MELVSLNVTIISFSRSSPLLLLSSAYHNNAGKMMKRMGSLDHPTAKWLLSEIEKGNELILEIIPSYYSTWRSAIPT